MKKVLILTLVIGFISCHSKSMKDKINVDNMKQFFIKSLLKDSTAKVDSFKLISIDTMFERNCYNEIEYKIMVKRDENINNMKEISNKLTYTEKMYRLMLDNPYAGNLLNVYEKDYKVYKDQIKELFKKDTLYQIDLNRLDTLVKRADTTNPICFTTKCFYEIQKSNFSVSKDTAYIWLNKDLQIIPYDEIDKVLPRYFKPVSGISLYN